MKAPNILAINLSLRPQSPAKIFPVGLSYVLSSLKRAGHQFDLFDIDMNRYSETERRAKYSEQKWDIVLLGCIVTGYSIVKPMLKEIRESNPEALVVVGNSVASSIPHILLDKTEADVAVMGEGDITVLEVMVPILLHISERNSALALLKRSEYTITIVMRTVLKLEKAEVDSQ